jgi:hypothetical protein
MPANYGKPSSLSLGYRKVLIQGYTPNKIHVSSTENGIFGAPLWATQLKKH